MADVVARSTRAGARRDPARLVARAARGAGRRARRRPSRGCRRSRRELLPRGISGRELAELEDGWAAAARARSRGAIAGGEADRLRGRLLFGIGARLLGGAGRARCSRRSCGRWSTWRGTAATLDSRAMLIAGARSRAVRFARADRRSRALGRDAISPSGRRSSRRRRPARAWALLRHRLTGRFTR